MAVQEAAHYNADQFMLYTTLMFFVRFMLTYSFLYPVAMHYKHIEEANLALTRIRGVNWRAITLFILAITVDLPAIILRNLLFPH
jgi:hypothetical protein